MRLTDKDVRNLAAAPGQRIEIPDDIQRGLRIRVTDKGVKTWSVQRRINGRKRRFTIGSYPEISLAKARDRAARLLVQAADGHDPVLEKRQLRQQPMEPTTPTLAEAIEAYGQHIRGDSRYQREKVSTLQRELAPLIDRTIESLTHQDLIVIVDQKFMIAPISANRLVAALSVFCKWMAQRGYTEDNLAARLTKPANERPRNRVLSLEEVRAVWEAAGQLGHPFGPLVRLLILTAQRREEVASMRWEEINFEKRLWSIPGERTKNGQPHLVPLSDLAIEILQDLAGQPIAAAGQGLVFTTTGTTPPSGFSHAKRRLDQLSDIRDWRLHDLRRTVVSHMADMGVDALVADRILNHVASSTMGVVQRTYQRSNMLAQRREALERWAVELKGSLE